MAMPRTVLMTASASAPARCASPAIAAISVTFGESFTISVLSVVARAARTTRAVKSGSQANVSPSLATLGHEMFSSTAAIASLAASRSQTYA